MAPVSALSERRSKDSVVAFVLDRIKAAITRGELKPGDLLPSETEMSAARWSPGPAMGRYQHTCSGSC
jgi:DNA-binding GntR family transcriptional regulator